MNGLKTVLTAMVIVCMAWCAWATTGAIITYPKFRGWTSAGKPLSGGLLYSYEPYSSTAKSLYSNKSLTTAATNPVVLDSNGEAAIWGKGPYKLVLKTSAGASVWSMDYVNGIGGTDGNYTIFPELYGAVGNGTTDDTLAIEAAIAACPTAGCRMVLTQPYRITANETIPTRAELEFIQGGRFVPDSGYKLTIDSPAKVIARNDQEIFTCTTDCVQFTKPGDLWVRWFGAVDNGTSDSYADLNATFSAAQPNSTINFTPGIFLVETGLDVGVGGGVNVRGTCGSKVENGTYSSTIKAGPGATGVLLNYFPDQPYPGQLRIECLVLDGNDTATNGLELDQSAGVLVKNVTAFDFTGAGFRTLGENYVGADTPLVYRYEGNFYGTTFDHCWSGENYTGYAVEREGTAVWGTITFRDCTAYHNNVSYFIRGQNETVADASSDVDYPTVVVIDGGQIEGVSSGYELGIRVKDGANVSFKNVYMELYNSGQYFWLSGNSRLDSYGGSHSPTDRDMWIEDNSTLCIITPGGISRPYATNYGGQTYAGFMTQLPMCFGGKTADKKGYGSPYWPWAGIWAGQGSFLSSGYHWKGQRFRDGYGTVYEQVEDEGYDGTVGHTIVANSGSKGARWSPVNGRITVPFTYTDLNTGPKPIYLSEVPFVVKSVTMVIDGNLTNAGTTDCAGAGTIEGVSVGTADGTSGRFTYISRSTTPVQGATANLKHGAVISSWDNNDTTKINAFVGNVRADTQTVRSRHTGFYMPKLSVNTADDNITAAGRLYPTSFIYLWACPDQTDPTWTGGNGTIIIEGYPLEFAD